MPLSVKDGIKTWIDDFKKSDNPKFDGKSAEKRRDMAIAAYMSAKNESVQEALLPTKDVEKVIGKGAKPIKNVKNSDGTKQSPMSRATTLAKRARDAQPVDEIFAVKPSATQSLHRKAMDQIRRGPKGPMTPPKKDPNSPEAQAAKRRADMMKARGRGPGFDESTNLGEAHAYSKAADALRDYANKHGGMDKKDFHTAAKHLDNVGKAGIMQKGQHLAKMNAHFKGLDTDVRDRIHITLRQHGVMEAVQVDELKKSTLGSYVKKAAQDAAAKAYSAAQKAMSNPDQSGKDYVKSVKRQKGIAKATDRLAREAKLDEISAKKLTNYIGLSKDEKGNIQKTGAAGSLEKSLKKSTDAFRSGDKEARRAATKTANKRAKGLQMARAKLDKKAGARFSVAKVPATEAKSFDQKFKDHLKFATSKSPAVRAYMKKRAADRDAMNKELDPNAAKKGYALSAVPPERAFGKARKKGMSAAAASQAVGTASRNRGRKLPK